MMIRFGGSQRLAFGGECADVHSPFPCRHAKKRQPAPVDQSNLTPAGKLSPSSSTGVLANVHLLVQTRMPVPRFTMAMHYRDDEHVISPSPGRRSS
jgi:hypothetical protein